MLIVLACFVTVRCLECVASVGKCVEHCWNDTESRRPKYPVDNRIQVHFVHHWNAAVVWQIFVCLSVKTEGITKYLCRCSQSPCRDLKPDASWHEAQMLVARPRLYSAYYNTARCLRDGNYELRKKLTPDWGREMLAIIRCRIFCLPGCCQKI